jgi:hypothetical protein
MNNTRTDWEKSQTRMNLHYTTPLYTLLMQQAYNTGAIQKHAIPMQSSSESLQVTDCSSWSDVLQSGCSRLPCSYSCRMPRSKFLLNLAYKSMPPSIYKGNMVAKDMYYKKTKKQDCLWTFGMTKTDSKSYLPSRAFRKRFQCSGIIPYLACTNI